MDLSKPKASGKKGTLLGSLISFGLTIVLLLAFRWVVAEPYVIPSGSMIPTLLINDHIFVNKLAFGIRWPFSKKWIWRYSLPERGDVVVFRSVEDDDFFMIKRVVGLPGDRIDIDEDGVLSVNGEQVKMKYMAWEQQESFYKVEAEDIGASFNSFAVYSESLDSKKPHRIMLEAEGTHWPSRDIVVPPDHLFLLGDNRDNSKDSRYWGALPVDNLLGRAVTVWLSCTETLTFAPYLCDPTTIRWRRLFHFIN